jgi:hypothetical protein
MYFSKSGQSSASRPGALPLAAFNYSQRVEGSGDGEIGHHLKVVVMFTMSAVVPAEISVPMRMFASSPFSITRMETAYATNRLAPITP